MPNHFCLQGTFWWRLLLSSGIWASVFAIQPLQAAPSFVEEQTATSARFLGMDLPSMTQRSVRQQLWQLGGFELAPQRSRAHTLDIFTSHSQLPDTYALRFYYNDLGQLVRLQRLYRPFYGQNQFAKDTPIKSDALARELSIQLGAPKVFRQTNGGFRAYRVYLWENEQMQVRLDRVGKHVYGALLLEYQIKNRDPYQVVTPIAQEALPDLIKNTL
ncbi:MAG: hypothetical protein JXR44_08095 [Thiotrichales bacterium]|nr:hypothetical protein [Thiotrichales bacterium]